MSDFLSKTLTTPTSGMYLFIMRVYIVRRRFNASPLQVTWPLERRL